MLNYQSTSFHDAVAMRRLFDLRPAPEFEVWLEERGLATASTALAEDAARGRLLRQLESVLETTGRGSG
jgi:ethanolamine ammonia-lyase large subunit